MKALIQRVSEASVEYDLFIAKLKNTGIPVSTGQFGAYMKVSLINDGPVTFLLDSRR